MKKFKDILEFGAYIIAEEERKEKEAKKEARRIKKMNGTQFSLFEIV